MENEIKVDKVISEPNLTSNKFTANHSIVSVNIFF